MKSIPIALQSHLDQDATTLCLLLRVRTKDGTVYGFTNLDADVVYNPATVDPGGTGDDWGSATHRADNGFTPERLQASADLNVDNTDLQGWVSDTGITEQQIRAGLFDYAQVRVYRVNYMDLTLGHELVMSGTCGETQYTATGWKTEFRSISQQLKQPVCQLYSLTCRARFGSKTIGTGGEQPEERKPCGKDWTWAGYTVTGVDTDEPDRIFTASAMAEATDYYRLGVVRWLTGSNAGAQMEVDANAAGEVTLSLPIAYDVEVGDTFEIRKDCSKLWDDADNGCLFHWGSERANHFRGEPDIPIADAGASQIPGAQ